MGFVINNSLTLEQELNIEKIKRDLNKLTRDKLERYVVELVRQSYCYKNNCAQLMKKELGIDEIYENLGVKNDKSV